MPPSDPPPTPPSSVSPLSESELAVIAQEAQRNAEGEWECASCGSEIDMRDGDPTAICDNCAHEFVRRLGAEVRALRRDAEVVRGGHWEEVIAERDAAIRERDDARAALEQALSVSADWPAMLNATLAQRDAYRAALESSSIMPCRSPRERTIGYQLVEMVDCGKCASCLARAALSAEVKVCAGCGANISAPDGRASCPNKRCRDCCGALCGGKHPAMSAEVK